jgi:hypothetical protein
MGAEQKKVVILSWVIAGLVMMIASAWDAIIVGWAVYKHPSVNVSVLSTIEPARTEFRRKEQRYFLDSGIYIPLEDIMFVDQLAKAGKSYTTALKENCSDLNDVRGLAIWLPLKIKIPLLGERVQEWCWRPNLQS